MSIAKTIFAMLGAVIIGVTTFFTTTHRSELKNRVDDWTKKNSELRNRENLFI